MELTKLALIANENRHVIERVSADGGLGVRDTFARIILNATTEPGNALVDRLTWHVGVEVAASMVLGDHDADYAGSEFAHIVSDMRVRADSVSVLHSLNAAVRCGARLYLPTSPLWPSAKLAELQRPPIALWGRGKPELLAKGGVALVGSRASTAYGNHVTYEFAVGAHDAGFPVISGAAYGIDEAAHRAVLSAEGETVAVLAGGVDRFYPSGNSDMLSRIVETGLVLAEMPCGSQPARWRFLARNRIIAALSDAVIVVEAGARSGSMNTAHHAKDMGRRLGAVPGSITSAASSGTHRLIQDGARLLASKDEAVEFIQGR